MWRDEVRAFSVATKAVSWASMVGDLHQEGHPVLWYAIVRLAFAIVHSNLILPVIALAIGTATAFVILRYCPFPFWLRLPMVFGTFLGYELTVVARNYGIGVLLMLIACVLFSQRATRPLLLGLVLALMANTSVHAAVASGVVVLIWLTDYLSDEHRAAFLRVASITGVALAIVGAAFAIVSARPSPDMIYATSFRQLGIDRIFSSIAVDPGKGLKGVYLGDIAASGELPLILFGINPVIMSRIVVDLCLISIGWGLWRSWRHLTAMIIAILCFEVLFGAVYPAALRHQGIVTFLLVGICWIAARESALSDRVSANRRIAFGLLPMIAIQAIAFPVVIRRHLEHPASSSRAFAGIIRSTPRLADATLISEPDYLMEPLPYYVANKIYMPRQHEYHFRVYFDNGAHRQRDLSLDALIDAADSLGCVTGKPVLLAIGYPDFLTKQEGEAQGAFHGTTFSWNAAERARLSTRGRLLGDFEGATTDENYQVFELAPEAPPKCATRPKVSHEGAL